MTQAAVGTTIGGYRIVRAIGEGGWSTVYEVVAPGGQHVALKRLGDGLAPETLARFRREVDSLRRLDHPGVLRLIDAGFDGTAPYLVTPLIQGTSLRGVMPLGVEGAIAVGVAAAVLLALPIVEPFADPWAGLAGAIVGGLCGLSATLGRRGEAA